jgi:hypothetical protein
MHENENAPPEFILTHCDGRTQLLSTVAYLLLPRMRPAWCAELK